MSFFWRRTLGPVWSGKFQLPCSQRLRLHLKNRPKCLGTWWSGPKLPHICCHSLGFTEGIQAKLSLVHNLTHCTTATNLMPHALLSPKKIYVHVVESWKKKKNWNANENGIEKKISSAFSKMRSARGKSKLDWVGGLSIIKNLTFVSGTLLMTRIWVNYTLLGCFHFLGTSVNIFALYLYFMTDMWILNRINFNGMVNFFLKKGTFLCEICINDC